MPQRSRPRLDAVAAAAALVLKRSVIGTAAPSACSCTLSNVGISRAAALLALVTVFWSPAAALAGVSSRPEYFQWQPNGPTSGPQLLLEVKADVTGNFGVQCGGDWVYASFGGGEHDPIVQNGASGVISGTETYRTNEIGIGSNYEAAQSNFELLRSGGPLVMTVNAQVTPSVAMASAATGTLALTLYKPGSELPAGAAKVSSRHRHKRRHKRARKPKRKPSAKASPIANCQVPFDAVNYYAET